MALKASLQLRIGTQLTMTPQLQQAIGLLQLSTLDLRQEVQQALEANPMLELEDEFGEQQTREAAEDDWADQIPSELSLDSDWSDTYQDLGTTPAGSGEAPDFERQASSQSLHSHLSWQLAMLDVSDQERLIAESAAARTHHAAVIDGMGWCRRVAVAKTLAELRDLRFQRALHCVR